MTRKRTSRLVVLAAAATVSLNVGKFTHSALAAAAPTDIYTETWASGTLDPTYYTSNLDAGAGTASVTSGELRLVATTTPGKLQVSTPTTPGAGSLYQAPFNPNLDANGNTKVLEWNLNFQQTRNNPNSFAAGSNGSAYVLSANNSNFLAAGGEGYAVIMGMASPHALSLAHYTNGLAAMAGSGKAAPFAMVAGSVDQDSKYFSARVTYTPGDDTWKFYVRDDGAAFVDAITTPVPDNLLLGSTVLQATAGGFSGFVHNHSAEVNTARFDNIKLTLGDAVTGATPTNLIWDADATGSATDGSGTWDTANSWIKLSDNTTHATWNDSAPDIATFGTGSGSGSFTVSTGAGRIVSQITFAANSPTYTISGGTITMTGYDDDANPGTTRQAMYVEQSATISAPMNWTNNGVLHVDGAGTTLTSSGVQSGSGKILKFGTGTWLITEASSNGGGMAINNGTVRVTKSTGGVSGLGTGLTEINANATLHLDATGGPITISNGGQLNIGGNSTLKVSGTVDWDKNYIFMATGSVGSPRESTIHVDSGGTFIQSRLLKNDSLPDENFHTIHVDGPGTLKLINGGAGASATAKDVFSGSWDLSAGTVILGQKTEKRAGSSGDVLNNLGFKGGDSTFANTATIRGSAVLIGTENEPNSGPGDIDAYRAGIILQGGTLASGGGDRPAGTYVGKDTNWAGVWETVAGTTSTIATYDPLKPAVARTTTLKYGHGWANGNVSNTTWNGNLVIDAGTTTGGAFVIDRTAFGGTINVGPNVTFTVTPGAGLTLKNSTDSISDGVDHVSVVNNSSAPGVLIQGSAKNVGNLDGTGSTTVDPGSGLTANRVRQSALTMNANVTVRQQGGVNGTSNIGTLTRDPSATLNLSNNNLVTGNAVGSWSGSYSGILGDVAAGRNGGTWNGIGIITNEADAQPGPGKTTLAVATGAQVKGLGVGQTATWAGQVVDDNDTLVMYTWNGDANLSGFVDADDYFQIDSNYGDTTASAITFNNGDFNYDGEIDGDDYILIDQGFAASQVNSPFPTAAPLGGVSAVPEPASLGMLVIAAAGLLGKRRRR